MAELHRSVQAMRYSYSIPPEHIAAEGFSGVLLGPDGDHDAKKVAQVLFTTDPSKTFDERDQHHSEQHAVRVAELNNWAELDQHGQEIPEGQEDISLGGLVRVVIGRNKDRYDGNKGYFSFEETQALLPANARFSMFGGYHFSDRPTWDAPYGEPAVVLEFTGDDPESYGEQDEIQVFRLSKALNDQHRITVLAPWGAEAFESNSNAS
jgi:hypothetical protein